MLRLVLMHTRILQLSRRNKRLAMLLTDALLIPFALWCAFALRLSTTSFDVSGYWWLFVATPAFSIPLFARLGLYRAVIRYMGPQAAFAVLKGVSFSTLALMASVLLTQTAGVPRSVFVIFWLIAVLYVGGTRFFIRAYVHWLLKAYSQRKLVAIYGAGVAGAQLASSLIHGDEYLPVAFIDDNKGLEKSVLNGVQVYGPDKLESLIKTEGISHVLLAVPSIRRAERQLILNRLEQLPVYVKTVPSLPELLSGRVSLDDIQDVQIEDLLGRGAIPPNTDLLNRAIRGRVVAVTGAAGSIGSELCRQIIEVRPCKLLLLDISEYGLYQIDTELRNAIDAAGLDIDLIPILGSVENERLMERVLRRFSVDALFHAAAYKHVPMVEHNVIAGVRNNVFGTYALTQAAQNAGVKTFVLVSTDKAVRPTNVMGATKRIAELILQGMADKKVGNTCFCIVRFGNVLGSSGSVVPVFRNQILSGGPVTVTHPDVSRYFMTIPEAAQLVIQASAVATGGDVFVLDMGEPVYIDDLARKIIHLMGCSVKDEDNANGDIKIVYTGLRPGEKLKEELLIGDNLAGTVHPKILRAEEGYIDWHQMEALLDQLGRACNDFNYDRIRNLLLEKTIGFMPDHDFVDKLADFNRTEQSTAAHTAKVTHLPRK